MTIDQAKLEFAVMSVMAKKLIALGESQRKRVLNSLLNMVVNENEDNQAEIKTLSFCVSRIDKMEKDQATSIVKFLVDRFFTPRAELSWADVVQEE
jgi:hypothetical protein